MRDEGGGSFKLVYLPYACIPFIPHPSSLILSPKTPSPEQLISSLAQFLA
jgi:hypothetical protein